MKRLLVILLVVLSWSAPALAHGTGRECNRSTCMMCNRWHMSAGHGKRIPGWWNYSRYVQLHSSLHRTPAKPKPQLEPKPVDDEYLAPVPDFVPTPQAVVDAALSILHPSPSDVLCDLGCGDGRVLITAAKTYGCRAIGVEHNSHNVAMARRNVKAAGVGDLVTIVEKDAREFDLDGVTVVWMYLDADLIAELKPKLAFVRCVLSFYHPVPGVRNEEVYLPLPPKITPPMPDGLNAVYLTAPVYFWIQDTAR